MFEQTHIKLKYILKFNYYFCVFNLINKIRCLLNLECERKSSKLELKYFKNVCTKCVNVFTFFYINRRKYWFHENIRFSVFDAFTRLGISWIWFQCFWKISVCLCVCLWQNICGKCSSRTNQQNLMKYYV